MRLNDFSLAEREAILHVYWRGPEFSLLSLKDDRNFIPVIKLIADGDIDVYPNERGDDAILVLNESLLRAVEDYFPEQVKEGEPDDQFKPFE